MGPVLLRCGRPRVALDPLVRAEKDGAARSSAKNSREDTAEETIVTAGAEEASGCLHACLERFERVDDHVHRRRRRPTREDRSAEKRLAEREVVRIARAQQRGGDLARAACKKMYLSCSQSRHSLT